MPSPKEIASLRLFLKKGAIFVVPFLLYAALMVALDPFEYFGISHLIDHQIKRKTAGKLHYTLWKSIQFLKDPRPNLLLGDSRMDLVSVSTVEQLTGERYFNFSYGGGTIPEMVDTFWFADRHVELHKVFIGIGFINFNRFQNMNRFTESSAILKNPLLYLTNRIVAKAAVYAVLSQIRGAPLAIEKPPMDREAFWRHQLGPATAAHYNRFKYPPEHLEALRKVAARCAEEGIQLTFVIPPSHVELQAKIAEFGLTKLADRFRRDLRSLGRVVDFDFPNAYTRDRANFSDPYHFHPTPMIVEQMLSDAPDPRYAR